MRTAGDDGERAEQKITSAVAATREDCANTTLTIN